VTSPPRLPSQNAGQQATRTQAVQLNQSEANEVENSTLPIDDQSKNSTSALSVEDAVKRISDFVAPTQSEISFSIDNVSGIQVVKIMDSQSNEVIRQFPSKEAIEIARALDKLQGLLIKDKA
jgi:flagellar protein FlaG